MVVQSASDIFQCLILYDYHKVYNSNKSSVFLIKLIGKKNKKKKPSKSKIKNYQKQLIKLKTLNKKKQKYYKKTITNLFLNKLTYIKIPYITKNIPLQLNTHLSTIKKSISTKKNFNIYIKILKKKKPNTLPINTSKNKIPQIKQYHTTSITNQKTKHTKIKNQIPHTKKTQTKKKTKKNTLTSHTPNTHPTHTNTHNTNGSQKKF